MPPSKSGPRAAGPERLITAFAPEGAPLHQWTRAWDCYADWLDVVAAPAPAT